MKFITKHHLLFWGIAIFVIPFSGFAESLGNHCWQQIPFAHVVCFDVNDVNRRYYALTGENITAEAVYPIDGAALFDKNMGKFRLTFTQNLGGTFVFENTVIIDPTTLSGTWEDDGGNSGEFQYLGLGPLDPEKLKTLTTRSTKKKKTRKQD